MSDSYQPELPKRVRVSVNDFRTFPACLHERHAVRMHAVTQARQMSHAGQMRCARCRPLVRQLRQLTIGLRPVQIERRARGMTLPPRRERGRARHPPSGLAQSRFVLLVGFRGNSGNFCGGPLPRARICHQASRGRSRRGRRRLQMTRHLARDAARPIC